MRETRFVEIGPLTAFGRRAAAELLPFPELRFGWGLDLHWAALAAERGWRLGVVDATPVRHESATVGSTYPRAEAEAEAAEFLASRPHLPAVAGRRGGGGAPPGGPLMRLLFLCPDMHRGGAERQWATLIPALARRGAEVRLVCLYDEGPLFEEVRAAGVSAECLGLRGPNDMRGLRRALAEARGRPGRGRHANGEPAAGGPGDRPARRCGARVQRAHAADGRRRAPRDAPPAAGCSPGWWRRTCTG